MQHDHESSPWRREPEAAAHVGLTPASLKTLRARGRGPRYHKAGKVVIYHVRDLNAYLERDVRDTIDSRPPMRGGRPVSRSTSTRTPRVPFDRASRRPR